MTALDDAAAAAVMRLYAAATGDGGWDAALGAVIDATGFDGAAIYVLDGPADAAIRDGSPVMVRGLWHRLNPEGQDDYAGHYSALDPRARYMARNPDVRLLHDRLHTAEAEMDRDPFYDWYFRTQETRYYLGGRTAPGLPFTCGVSLHRRARLGPAGPEDLARFAPLFDHLERAVAVEHRLFRASVAGLAAEAAVEANPAGLVLLGAGGRVIHANPAARALAVAGDALTLGVEGLGAARGTDAPALRSLLGRALAGEGGGPVRLRRNGGRRDLLVMAVPVASGPGLFAEWAPVAMVLILDPDATPEPPEAALRRAFGLTTAEARLLARLAAGDRLDEAASRLGIATATARTQLSSVFAKTGTSRQAELMRLVAAVPWALTRGHIRT